MNSGWRCPNCGQLDGADIALYPHGDMFNACSRRFDPHCATCGSPATFDRDECKLAQANPDAKVIIISGSCSSGKTTVSYLLSERHGFVQVDGDWVQESLRDKRGRRADFNEIHDYLLHMAEGLVSLGRSVAIAHVVLPGYLPRYQRFFRERGIAHRIVLLMPRMPVLLRRNAERVCWPKTTPERWVNKFYQDFQEASEEVKALFYDNSRETPEKTTDKLLAMMGSAKGLAGNPGGSD